jgi:hypothetical protein
VRDPVILADGDELVRGIVVLLFRCFRRGEVATGWSRTTLPIAFAPEGSAEEPGETH